MIEIHIGKTAQSSRVFTFADIEVFSAVSGDFNSSQGDTQSGRRMVHPALLAASANALIKTHLPGPTASILEQSFSYLNPVHANEKMIFQAEIAAVQSKKNLLVILLTCISQEGLKVMEGEAVVYLPEMIVVEKPGE